VSIAIIMIATSMNLIFAPMIEYAATLQYYIPHVNIRCLSPLVTSFAFGMI